MRLNDLTGKRFGKWTVRSRHPENYRRTFARWFCVCDCGTERIVLSNALLMGRSQCCGCVQYAKLVARQTKHGCSKRFAETLTYQAWKRMRQRCQNPSHKDFKYYGGRGISVHGRWEVFENFLTDMGEKLSGLTIDRIDNNGNYEPGNCRWATMAQQNANKRGKFVARQIAEAAE